MNNNRVVLVFLSVIVILAAGYGAYRLSQTPGPKPVSSAPEVPSSPNVPSPQHDAYANLIRVSSPQANTLIASPVFVVGEARGPWYFEASFPVVLMDVDGKILAQAAAQAKGEWMTEKFVPFEAQLPFSAGNATSGVLVLKRDNPSGNPETANEIRIPVKLR